jgi:hypothetical protein
VRQPAGAALLQLTLAPRRNDGMAAEGAVRAVVGKVADIHGLPWMNHFLWYWRGRIQEQEGLHHSCLALFFNRSCRMGAYKSVCLFYKPYFFTS